MNSKELKIDWLYRLKMKMLFSIIVVLTVSIVVTMIFIAVKLRDTLVNDSKLKTQELAVTINSNLRHLMILRSPQAIQDTFPKPFRTPWKILWRRMNRSFRPPY